MLQNFETWSVDEDVWAAIRNVQADFRAHIADAIRQAVERRVGYPVTDSLLLAGGSLIRIPGSEMTHYAYQGQLCLAWSNPVMEKVGVTRVHLTYQLGTLPAPSAETIRMLNETIEG